MAPCDFRAYTARGEWGNKMTILEFLRGAVVNLFVLLGFVTLCSLTRERFSRRQAVFPAWQQGLLFGVMACVAMLVPVMASPGMIFDCRSGVIGGGALLGGPMVALLSLPLPCAYRLNLGGAGTLPGVLELVLPALCGSVFHIVFRHRRQTIGLRHILVASVGTGVCSNGIILALIAAFMPASTSQVGNNWAVAVVVLSTPISMALLCALLVMERRHSEALAVLADRERRMLHSQKMAAVGQLSQKVAHSFANALTAILGGAQQARDNAHDAADVQQLMDGVIGTTRSASSFVAELLAFSAPRPLRMRQMDAGKCIAGIGRLLEATIGPAIEVEIDAGQGVGRVEVDPTHIEQAVVHLAVNASEAMSGNGRLSVRVARADLSEHERDRLQAGVADAERHTRPFAVISVEDTGCGMDAETASRIFEPFFTTKNGQDNAGLGLASVYNIVKLHHGYVDLHTRPGLGSTFFIYLPIVDPASA